MHLLRWPVVLSLAAALCAAPSSRAQTSAPSAEEARPQGQTPPPNRIRPGLRAPVPPQQQQQRPPGPARAQPAPAQPPSAGTNPNAPTRDTEPGELGTVNKADVHTNAKTVVMSFDKRDLAEVIQFVSQFTQRNFILPERVSGKITILSNSPIPAEEVWNVFVAALDANNWALYPVGKYWKLTE